MIEMRNLTAISLNDDFFKKIAGKVLESEDRKFSELSIVFVGQAKIRALNKKYRKKNKATDILSFNYNGSGEIIICLREVRKNAKRFELLFKKELTKVLIHGILHLIGHDHEKNKEMAGEMQKKEEYYLKLLWQN